MLKVILTAAALFGDWTLGGYSMLQYIKEAYPATWYIFRQEHKFNKEKKKALEAKDDA